MRKNILQFVLLIFVLSACTENKNRLSMLNNIESYIDEEPQRALAELREIKDSIGASPKLKAKHALLHSIALDKNYIDLKTDSIIAPAVKYYLKKGSGSEKLATCYYLGRIYKNAGDYNKAIIEYSKAEQLVDQISPNKTIGLLYMGMAAIYNAARNHTKEIEYVQKGYNAFKLINSERDCNLSLGTLAIAYSNLREWDIADSLFNKSTALCSKDSITMPFFLSNYARIKVLQPEKDPNSTISLLNRKFHDYGKALSVKDYCVYAYALALQGKDKECDAILNAIKDSKNNEFEYWLYLINYHRGNYQNAIELLNYTYAQLDKEIEQYLSNSVEKSLGEYYKQREHLTKIEFKNTILRLAVFLLAIIVISFVIVFLLINNNKKQQREIELYLKLSEDIAKQLDDYESQLTYQSAELKSLQKAYVKTYKKQFTDIGELCRTYLIKKETKDVKNSIYRKVEQMVSHIGSDDQIYFQLERQINKEQNNILVHLKEDLPNLSKEDMRFICYCIIGFDANLISLILNISTSNVYTKKSRLKSKINTLSSPRKEEYLSLI